MTTAQHVGREERRDAQPLVAAFARKYGVDVLGRRMAKQRRVGRRPRVEAGRGKAVVQVEGDLELVVDDLLAGLAHDEVDDGSGPGEAFEEPPSVGDAGASGDGEDEAALGHRTLFSATHWA